MWSCPACELSTHAPVFFLHQEVRQGHRDQLDGAAERQSCHSLLSAVAEWLPATNDNYPITPEGSQDEVTPLGQSRQNRLVALSVFHSSAGQAVGGGGVRHREEGRSGQRERGWVTSWFFISFSIAYCLHLPESSAPCALDTKYHAMK